MRAFTLTAAIAAALSLTACETYAAGHAVAPAGKVATSAGDVLADQKGMTLYTFDNDAKGVSNCYNDCADAWPPFAAAADAEAAGQFEPIKRKDGSMQWAFKGQPLYTWVGDSASGDITGDGVGGVWHLARP